MEAHIECQGRKIQILKEKSISQEKIMGILYRNLPNKTKFTPA